MKISQIKQILKERKITYAKLAELSGVSVKTLESIFAGNTPHPRIDTMQAIERALGIDETPQQADSRPAVAQIVERCAELTEVELYAVLGFISAILANKSDTT